MICEFQKQYTMENATKTVSVLREVADNWITVNEKNTSTAPDNPPVDIQEALEESGCDHVEEDGEKEDGCRPVLCQRRHRTK